MLPRDRENFVGVSGLADLVLQDKTLAAAMADALQGRRTSVPGCAPDLQGRTVGAGDVVHVRPDMT